ncbi:MAG: exonuclease [Rhodospirillales bacterium]|nr:exonuclease [Rhodospirillales bacterium]
MGPRAFLIVCFVILSAAVLGAVAAGVLLIERIVPEAYGNLSEMVIVYGGGLAFLLIAFVSVLWAYLDFAIAQPLAALVGGIQTVIYANPDYRIEIDDSHRLGSLPQAVTDLVTQLGLARSRVDEAITDATSRVEVQKRQLETIIQDLHEGVIVCNLNHEVLLYNRRALELLHIGGQLGLARSLFTFTNRQPILHALGRLTNRIIGTHREVHPEGLSAPFVCATTDGRHTLEGRMSLMLDAEESPNGYVISFADNTEKLASLGLRDRLLRESTEGLRGSVGNLRAASEILSNHPDMPANEQAPFKQVVMNEADHLSNRLEQLATQYRDVITGHWPTSDIYSSNLFNNLLRRLRDEKNIQAVMTGIPQWLHGDSYTLVELLDRLIHNVSRHLGVTTFDLEATGGERHIYLDVVWAGEPISAAALDSWLTEQLEETYGRLSLREVLEHHKTDVWSLPYDSGRARLRLPLPPATQTATRRDTMRRSSRPEFYDFDLILQRVDSGDLGDRPLKSLTYVVFDTETTGLQPSAGDEIISIAGVRIVNSRILTGESFERLVDPKRVIPYDSVKFHGITDDMVKDKPPIQVVLPQFRDYVGEAVMVAHNAAFDLKFLKLKEIECGLTFDMPILDTLLLSVFIHDHTTKHSLDAAAARFGIEIRGRHTALGDSLVTAGVFLRMLDVLEARGVRTLNEAIEASNKIVEVRAQQAKF